MCVIGWFGSCYVKVYADWWRERMYVLFISFKSVVCWILMSADVLLVRIERILQFIVWKLSAIVPDIIGE